MITRLGVDAATCGGPLPRRAIALMGERRDVQARHEDSSAPAAVGSLAAGLVALSRSPSRHDRLAARLAVTYRPCISDADALPRCPVELADFRLFDLTHRYVDRRGFVARAIYRAEVDPADGGRVRFGCDRVMAIGAAAGRGSPDARMNLSAARAAFLIIRELEDAGGGDLIAAPALPGLLAEPRLARLGGSRRNPRGGYRAFVERARPRAEEGLPAPVRRDPAGPAGRFRSSLAAFVDTNGVRFKALMADLRAGFTAAGVPVPEDPGSDNHRSRNVR